MDAADLRDILESGVAMLGTSADADLVPEAFRVWGASLDDDNSLRALVSFAGRTLTSLHDGARISFVFTDITTFRSLQVKGTVSGSPAPPGPADAALMRQYDTAFGATLAAVGHPPRLVQRIRPVAVFAVQTVIDQLYDQTPGPAAGALLEQARRG